MGAFDGMSRFFGNIAYEAKRRGYCESNILLLNNEDDKLKEKYPAVYNNLSTCVHAMDSRTPEDYGRDLVANWLFEDFIADMIRSSGFNVIENGVDKSRNILQQNSVKSTADYIVSDGDNKVVVELCSNYTNYWFREGKIDFRDWKFDSLARKGNLVMCVSVSRRSFAIYNPCECNNIVREESHKQWGGKPCCSILINQSDFKPLNANNIREEFEKYI